MDKKTLIILCGIPGSGKSTWAHENLCDGDAYVSRDEVRFSIISDDEDYFAHETQVFNKFITKIEEHLKKEGRVFADATHINWASRRKLLERIHNKENINIGVYVFATPLNVCLERNEHRNGRAQVPKSVIKRMFFQFQEPFNDPFSYHIIKRIFPNGEEEDLTKWKLN